MTAIWGLVLSRVLDLLSLTHNCAPEDIWVGRMGKEVAVESCNSSYQMPKSSEAEGVQKDVSDAD